MHDATLHATVEAAKSGDHEAFARLHDEFAGLVRSAAGSDDVSQQAWLRVLAKLPLLRDATKLTSWLRSVAWNERRRLARKASVRWCDRLVVEVADDGESPLASMIRDEERAKCREVVGSLKPADSEILRLHYFDCEPIRRMCVLCSAPLGTIKRRLHTARRRLALAYRRAS